VVRILASGAGDPGLNPGRVHVAWERKCNGNCGSCMV